MRVLLSKKYLAAVAIGLLAMAGCATPEPEPSTSSPTSSPSPTASNVDVVVYFMRDTPTGFKLFEENRSLDVLGDPAIEATTLLLEGELAPIDSDYTSLWGVGNEVNSITVVDQLATIDMKSISLNVGSSGEAIAIAQVVWTITGNDSTITEVLFTLNGEPIESLAGHMDATEPFTRGEGYEVLSAVMVTSLNDGDEVAGMVEISGLACTFEANVAWALFRDGKRIAGGSTLSSEACPATSPWTVELGVLDSGYYIFYAREYSAKDGSLAAEDSKTFTVDVTSD